MAYIGRQPTAAALTSSDIAADIITAAKIADDAISEEHLDATAITGFTALGATPADTDEFLVSDAGTLKRVDYSYIKGGGITQASQWRITANFTGGANPVSSNWEEDDLFYSRIGDAMSVSSGIWTFPETGIWLVTAHANYQFIGEVSYHELIIYGTDDNSSYSTLGGSHGATADLAGSNTAYSTTGNAQVLFDVTNTSNDKVKIGIGTPVSSITKGDSGSNMTWIQFVRLGDT